MFSRVRSAKWDYALALLLTIIATAIRWSLHPVLGTRAAFATYFLASFLMVWIAGAGPGLVTLILGGLAASYFFLEPFGSFVPQHPADQMSLVVYALVGITGGLFSEAHRRAERRGDIAAKEAEAQREWLRAVVESIDEGVVATDASGKIVTVNAGYEGLSGRSRDTLLKLSVDEAIHLVDEQTAERVPLHVAGSGSDRAYLAVRPDGSTLPVDVRVAAVQARARAVGSVILLRDTSAARRTETELLRAAAVIDNSGDAILSKTLTGVITNWNAAAQQIYGYTAQEIVGQNVSKLVPPELIPEMRATMERAALGDGVTVETERIRKDGRRISVSLTVSPLRGKDGRVVGISTIARDITLQKQAEAALRDSDLRLRLALSAGRMGTWMNDIPAGRVIWSPELENLFGLEPGSFPGTEAAFRDLIHQDDRAGVLAEVTNAVTEQREYAIEFRFRRKDGSMGWMEGRGRPYFDGTGALIRLAGTAMDITARKQLEIELKRRTEDLTRSNHDLEQFAYISSHDLQEPLRTMGLFTQMLASKYAPQFDAQAKEFMNFIVNASLRMQAQIHGLLEYSRVGRSGVEPKLVHSDAALRAAIQNLESSIRATGAHVTSDPLPPVIAGDIELVQIFQNLIGNAIKFRRSDSPPRIHITAVQTQAMCTFAVRDNGIGIEKQYLEQIFDIFRRLHTTHQGTGIGLAICKRAVERLGGEIWVESTPGVGSTFYFTTPAASTMTIAAS